ncbi:hypothetical protein ACU4GD_17430 [Cupriavidus basilensis]
MSEARTLAAIGEFGPFLVIDLARFANLDKSQASRAADHLIKQGTGKARTVSDRRPRGADLLVRHRQAAVREDHAGGFRPARNADVRPHHPGTRRDGARPGQAARAGRDDVVRTGRPFFHGTHFRRMWASAQARARRRHKLVARPVRGDSVPQVPAQVG